MKKLLITTLLIMFIVPCLRAQKKEISQARSYMKSGKNLDKAEQLMVDLLKDSLNWENPKIHATLYDAVMKQYEAGNERLYLGQQYDTAKLFNHARRLFEVSVRFDSIDARPDKKGRVRPEYRKEHAEELDGLRPNLYLGGRYFIGKSNYAKAFDFFDTYIDCGYQPLFTGYDYLTKDPRMTEAAYWATYSGYMEQNPRHVMKHASIALKDETRAQYILQYVAEAHHTEGNDNEYLKTLKEGFCRYPEHAYFFPRLTDYYIAQGQTDKALDITRQALSHNPDNQVFLFAESTLLLNMGQNEESLNSSNRLIRLNDMLAEPYFNAATAILNQISPLEQTAKDARNNRNRIRLLYEQARPLMERYRQLAPDQQAKWAPALYKIYLNLNMGKQFDEMDKILKKLK